MGLSHEEISDLPTGDPISFPTRSTKVSRYLDFRCPTDCHLLVGWMDTRVKNFVWVGLVTVSAYMEKFH